MTSELEDPRAAAQVLREQMVTLVLDSGHARDASIQAAMRAVERHAFLPDASLTDAYADIAVAIKTADDGRILSCASVPTVVAMMLDQLDVRPGQRILEIGAGTGYNAALLAHLTGPTGHVTTIDLDSDVTAHARRNLDATGHHDVEVLTRDGALGAQENAPYDRIIVTVGAWDIPTAWWDQLTAVGRLVVPLRWRGQTRSLALHRQRDDVDRLDADSVRLCGFVPMVGQEGELSASIDATNGATNGATNDAASSVRVFWDADQPVDPNDLSGVLARTRTDKWSLATIGSSESFDGIWLHLSATEATTCRLAAGSTAVAAGLVMPAIASRTPALASGTSLAYLTHRRLSDRDGARTWQLGAIGHGPQGDDLTERICRQIRRWDQDRDTEPAITIYRSSAAAAADPGLQVIRKPVGSMVVAFGPQPST